jgi:hypothetical protein
MRDRAEAVCAAGFAVEAVERMNRGRGPDNSITPAAAGLGTELDDQAQQASVRISRHAREAERLYREVLTKAPGQTRCVAFPRVLGPSRAPRSGARLDGSRAQDQSGQCGILYNRANTLRDMGQLEKALAGYDAAPQRKKDMPRPSTTRRGIAFSESL